MGHALGPPPSPSPPQPPQTHPRSTQDLTEAKANVNKRLDYIRGEMGRVDGQLKALQEKGQARQQEVRAAGGRERGGGGPRGPGAGARRQQVASEGRAHSQLALCGGCPADRPGPRVLSAAPCKTCRPPRALRPRPAPRAARRQIMKLQKRLAGAAGGS
jgi:hypothetical protein